MEAMRQPTRPGGEQPAELTVEDAKFLSGLFAEVNAQGAEYAASPEDLRDEDIPVEFTTRL